MARTSRRPGRGRRFIIVAAGMAGILLVAVASALAASQSPSPGAAKAVLRIGYTTDADNLNPFIGYGAPAYETWHLNYDLLFGYSAKDLSPTPEFAAEVPTVENGGISADGKTWTIKIRPNMKWQDGEAATARDVAFTYNYIIQNDMVAFSSYTKHIVKAVALDDTTVQLICDAPKPNMLTLWIPILPEHIWSKVSPKEAAAKYPNSPPIIGSGPFKTVEWKKGQYIRLVKNPDYWRGAPKIDEVYLLAYQDSDTMVQELKAGDIDAAYSIPPAQFDKLNQTKGLKAISYTTPTWDYLVFNCYTKQSLGNPVLRDLRFRTALSWAVDRETIVKLAYIGLAKVGSSIIPPGTVRQGIDYHWEPPADVAIGFDLDKARQLLDAAGYTDTNGDGKREYKGNPITLRLWSRAQSATSQRAGKLIAGWLKQLGLTIKYQVMDQDAIGERLYRTAKDGTYEPDFDMYLWDFVGYQDAGDTLASFTTEQIALWNDPCWSNAEFDQLNLQQQQEVDPQKRADLLKRMQELFYLGAPEVPFAFPEDLAAYNVERWAGWVRGPEGNGGTFYTNNNMDTYLTVHLISGSTGESSSSAMTIVLVVVPIVVVVLALGVWLLLRRRVRAQAEED